MPKNKHVPALITPLEERAFLGRPRGQIEKDMMVDSEFLRDLFDV